MAKMDAKKVLIRILAVVVGLFFLSSAYPKLMLSEQMVRAFDNWGYPKAFLLVIGMLEGLGGIAVVFPRLATWGGGVLVVVMAGAVYTHLSTGIGSPAFALASLVAAGAVAWIHRGDALLLGD